MSEQGETYELTHEWCEAKIAECVVLRTALEKSADISDREMVYLDGTGWGINALRSAIIRADDCRCATLKRDSVILREALERVATGDCINPAFIARKVIERAGGAE